MTKTAKMLLGIVLLVLPGIALGLSGCGVPSALKDAQRAQLALITQYADSMDGYHRKVQDHLLKEKLRELDRALAASLHASADPEGRVALSTAQEKMAKRLALEAEFRANLSRLDAQFQALQVDIQEAVALGEKCLGVLEDYVRLGHELRNLLFRDTELENIVRRHAHETGRGEPSTGRDKLP